ncbi:hypothetical protein [Hoylesella shahii]|nr:hypothetical protein [Hoylesella shahii]
MQQKRYYDSRNTLSYIFNYTPVRGKVASLSLLFYRECVFISRLV